MAHRYSLEQKLGRKIFAGMFACHKCDTPLCVNPDHLYEGTVQSNSDDMVARGRQAKGDNVLHRSRGEHHYSARLTEADVCEIRSSKEIPSKLAVRYGISKQAVHRVRNNITWKHVEQRELL